MKLKAGTLFQITVGYPGPDVDTAVIISLSQNGYYIKRYSCWTEKITETLWEKEIIETGVIYPNQIPQWALTELKEAGRQSLEGGE